MPHFAVYVSTVPARCRCTAQSPVAWVPAARSRYPTPECSTRAPRLFYSSCPEALLRAASVLAPGVQRPPVGTRTRGKEKHVLGTEQNHCPPPPRGTVEGGLPCGR